MQTKNLKTIAKFISFLIFIGIFISLEMIARYFTPPKTELDKILDILRQNPHTLWQIKPNLTTEFQGVPINTNKLGLRNRSIQKKPKNTKRILCLGGSPTFGWGVKETKAYPQQLETILNNVENRNNEFEVINAGIIGFSTFQGLQFLKTYGLALNPDIITISYVVNDVDKHRFYRNTHEEDKALKPVSAWMTFTHNLLNQSYLTKLLQKMINRMTLTNTRYYGKAKIHYPEHRRVSSTDYKNNIKEMISLAQKQGIEVILIKMPIQKPLTPALVSNEKIQKAKSLLKEGLQFAKEKEINKTVNSLKKSISLDPYNPKTYYYLGYFLNLKGDIQNANNHFQSAKKYEFLECANLSIQYNEIMEMISQEENIPLIDVARIFKKTMNETGKTLYVNPKRDFVHPDSDGHSIIASYLSKRILTNTLQAHQNE